MTLADITTEIAQTKAVKIDNISPIILINSVYRSCIDEPVLNSIVHSRYGYSYVFVIHCLSILHLNR
jgi:hypothetical protein